MKLQQPSCILLALLVLALPVNAHKDRKFFPESIELNYPDGLMVTVSADIEKLISISLVWDGKEIGVPASELTGIGHPDIGAIHVTGSDSAPSITIDSDTIESITPYRTITMGFGGTHCAEYGCPCTVNFIFSKHQYFERWVNDETYEYIKAPGKPEEPDGSSRNCGT